MALALDRAVKIDKKRDQPFNFHNEVEGLALSLLKRFDLVDLI